MRIIGGMRRGKRLNAPPGMETRPTTDRVRESLFNILEHRYAGHLRGGHVLDCFAGSGALSLEALSRGAAQATLLEISRPAMTCARGNAESCGFVDACQFLPISALKLPNASHPASLIFLDPPYGKGLAAQAIPVLQQQGWINGAETLLVIEAARSTPEPLPEMVTLLDERRFGETLISFARIEIEC